LQLVALGLTGCAYVVLALFARFIEPRLAFAGVMLAGTAIVYDVRRSSLHRVQAFRRYTVVEVVRAVVSLMLTILILTQVATGRAALLLFALAASYALGAVMVRSAVFRKGSVTTQRLIACVRGMMTRESGMLLTFFVLMGLMAQLPVLLYRPLAGTSQYAEFGAAFRYYGLLVSITSAFHVVTMPAIANVTEEGAAPLVGRMLRIAVFALMLVAGAVLATYVIMPFVDGGRYPNSPLLFVTMAAGLPCGTFCGIYIASFQRSGRLGVLVFSQAVCVAVTAGIIWSLAGAHPIAAAGAVPMGIAVQLGVLFGFTRKTGLVGLLTEPRVS
jgi:O-antigen/teichoic acid export membrane protein